ncbi:hypothetical protein [Caballeronia sp. AZ10_KS36]|uniref:flavodoxin family protein n=1 Tax=Caballeronia sp. AZ10_KS36 TaxID=2921757 RepID=UPI002028108A|nr:hypothetical protein [Caballeronia sp. AZ10_KS36]
MSKVLVVCYSRTGKTRALGEALAARLQADLEVITEPVDRSGVLGFVRAIFDTVFARPVQLHAGCRDATAYELVVIGTPVWAGTVSAPVRAWLALNRRKLPYVAFFCTENARGETTAFRNMATLAGKQPVARCAIKQGLPADDARRLVDVFVDRIERKLTRIDQLEWAA